MSDQSPVDRFQTNKVLVSRLYFPTEFRLSRMDRGLGHGHFPRYILRLPPDSICFNAPIMSASPGCPVEMHCPLCFRFNQTYLCVELVEHVTTMPEAVTVADEK